MRKWEDEAGEARRTDAGASGSAFMKQVIVVREDLKLGKGKMAAHVAHASLAAYQKVNRSHPEVVEDWESWGEKKVVVGIRGESAIIELYERVKREIPCELIRDAGLTQIEPGTITALGIGPWNDEKIDKFTGHLKLL